MLATIIRVYTTSNTDREMEYTEQSWPVNFSRKGQSRWRCRPVQYLYTAQLRVSYKIRRVSIPTYINPPLLSTSKQQHNESCLQRLERGGNICIAEVQHKGATCLQRIKNFLTPPHSHSSNISVCKIRTEAWKLPASKITPIDSSLLYCALKLSAPLPPTNDCKNNFRNQSIYRTTAKWQKETKTQQ